MIHFFFYIYKNQGNINGKRLFNEIIYVFTIKDPFTRKVHVYFLVSNYMTGWHLSARCAGSLQEQNKGKMAMKALVAFGHTGSASPWNQIAYINQS